MSTAPGGTITIAGKTVSRLGLGTMRLTGPGTWGMPREPHHAVGLIREAVHTHGITHIDTADAYGPHAAEHLISWALYPYPGQVLIATKVGMIRPAPGAWTPLGDPAYLRASVESSLRRLAMDRLDLCYLHRVVPAYPLADQLGTLKDLQDEGKIGHIGLSKVTTGTIVEARRHITVAAVQNVLNTAHPHDPVLDLTRALGIPYVPYRPLNAGALAAGSGPGDALRWLMKTGDHLAPIPGTSAVEHLRQLVTSVTTQVAL
ncbi:Predicted oxidoreductase [Actinacidiphila alni]|uniref:Predicted oxidoreductase n=1 Tax=Actinacidiphila alni TaxID=380248 RepID=A0A1I2LA52_9ACTN|nr:aldo/keto reductase [Actinacidiphila alni]SFF75360.1 Predicted oxidoreductase [Actinacidiphila alni]